jgi:hypothetical protein
MAEYTDEEALILRGMIVRILGAMYNYDPSHF